MRVTIDDTRCRGHGMCAMGVPDLFAVRFDDDESHGYVVVADVPEERRGDVMNAVASCPERAISLADHA